MTTRLPTNLTTALQLAAAEFADLDAKMAADPAPTAVTAEQIKQQFRQRGETITNWAQRNGYKRAAVYRVLNGQEKGFYGQAHEIAVKLGMKPAADSHLMAA